MEKTLKEIIGILKKTEGLKAYALIGGLAVGGWVTPRATKDIDIMVNLPEVKRSVIEKGILQGLIDSGFEASLKIGAPEDDIRFCIKAISREGIPVDIIFASRGWEGDIAEEGVLAEVLKGVSIPIVRPEGLIVLKLRAGSLQDVADTSRLLMEAEYDPQRLLALAKRARVDKRLIRLMKRLGV